MINCNKILFTSFCCPNAKNYKKLFKNDILIKTWHGLGIRQNMRVFSDKGNQNQFEFENIIFYYIFVFDKIMSSN